MFDIELGLAEAGSSSHTVILRRDYQEFRALHLALSSLLTSSKKDVTLPTLPQYSEGSTDAQMAEAVTTYLYELMALPDVTASRQFLSLLNDHDGAGGAESSGMVPENAVDFLLQPCSFTSLYVARRAKHEEEIEVPAGSTVLWRFLVGDGLDIQFKATFRPHPPAAASSSSTDNDAASPPLLPSPLEASIPETLMEGRFPSTEPSTAPPPSPTKPGGGGGPDYIQGSHTAPSTSRGGICTLTWDNAYSRLRGKQVQYVLQVVTEEAMQAAVEAAEELSRASSRNRSLITSRIQAGEGGREGGKMLVTVTPVARPVVDTTEGFGLSSAASSSSLGGGGGGGGGGGEIEEEKERIVAGGRGGLGILSATSTSSLSDLDQALKAAGASGAENGSGSSSSSSSSSSSGGGNNESGGNMGDGASAASTEGGGGGGGGRVRRSSLGVMWDYLYSSKEDANKGGEAGGWQQQQQQQQLQQQQLPHPDFERVVGLIERLEDELAHMTAKKEQAEAEAVIALAKQRRWSIEKEKFERKMHEAVARGEAIGEQVKQLQGEKMGLEAEVLGRQQEVEAALEAAKRAERERDVLKAEKHVWTVAHSGVQAELTSLSGTLEKERQAHEDTRAALKKAKEAAHRAKGEAETLKTRLEVKVDERALQTAQEELGSARAEIRDLSEALEETAAENDTLRGQMKLLAKHVKQQKQDMALLQAEVGELRMHVAQQEKKVGQLKAEKKLLVKEIKARASAVAGAEQGRPPLSALSHGQASLLSSSSSVESTEEGSGEDVSEGRGGEEGGGEGKGGGAGAGDENNTLEVEDVVPEPERHQASPSSMGAREEMEAEEEEEEEGDAEEEQQQEAAPEQTKEESPSDTTPASPSSPSSTTLIPAPISTDSPSPLPSPSPSPPKQPSPSAAAAPPPSIKVPAPQPPPFPILSPRSVSDDDGSPRSSSSSNSNGSISSSSALDKDERYQRLLSQLRNVTERRKQLLLLCEEDPHNENVKQLVADLEGVLGNLKMKMRAMLEAAGESGGQRRR